MLKKRLVASVIIRDGWAVQSIGFQKYLPLGRPEIAVEFFNDWGADEILVIDIQASKRGKSIDPRMIERLSKKAFAPLTVAGGLTSLQIVRDVLSSGADKVAVGASARSNHNIIPEVALNYGRQCIVGIVDYVKKNQGSFVYDHIRNSVQEKEALSYAQELVKKGVGEVLFQSVDLDGALKGYDLNFLNTATREIEVPVIAAGGAGHPEDLQKLFQNTRAHAAAAGNFLNYTEHSILTIKSFLSLENADKIRCDKNHPYRQGSFDAQGRVLSQRGLL